MATRFVCDRCELPIEKKSSSTRQSSSTPYEGVVDSVSNTLTDLHTYGNFTITVTAAYKHGTSADLCYECISDIVQGLYSVTRTTRLANDMAEKPGE